MKLDFVKRLAALLLAIGLAGCGGSPPQTFAPLNYSYLPPITLKVATVNVVNSYATDPNAAQLMAQDPAPPPAVLGTELARRLIASGTPGTATATIEDASVANVNGTLTGAMAVRIDVASADGASSGFTEASVSHSAAAPDSDDDMPAALYDMTKQLMDAMNVQLQYHVQHDLGAWVVTTSNAFGVAPGLPAAPAGGAILAAPLAAPADTGAPSVPGAPQSLTAPAGAPPGAAPPLAPQLAPQLAPLPGQTLQLPPSYTAPPAPSYAAPPYVAPPAPPPLLSNPGTPQIPGTPQNPGQPQSLVPY